MNELHNEDVIDAIDASAAAVINENKKYRNQSNLIRPSIATTNHALNEESHKEDAIFDAAAAVIDEDKKIPQSIKSHSAVHRDY